MIKLITPPSLLLTTAVLAIYAVYAFRIGSIEDSVPMLIGGCLSVVGCVGAALMKPWSRYLTYTLAVGATAKLATSVHAAAAAGFFDFQFGSIGSAVRSLVPEAAMVALGLACCILSWREFRPQQG
jgi:hypothetical protein